MRVSSISRRLTLSLLGVGIVGLAVLLGFILLDYHITFSALDSGNAFEKALREVAAHVVLPALVVAVPMGLAAIVAVNLTLRPISRIAEEVARAGGSGASGRISADRLPAEIAPLATGFNRVLDQASELAERNAAFADDVAHELRTPLTLLALELDQLMRQARIEAGDIEPLRQQVQGMNKLVNQLMQIARLDMVSGQEEAAGTVDLREVAMRVVAQMAPAALSGGRDLAFEDLGAEPVDGEAEAIAAALRNLVENGLRVTPTGQAVTVIAGPGRLLAVADGGPGLSSAELDRLGHRHVRADHASAGGAGLGLAIVRKIVAAHGGTLASDQQMRRIVMTFPARRRI